MFHCAPDDGSLRINVRAKLFGDLCKVGCAGKMLGVVALSNERDCPKFGADDSKGCWKSLLRGSGDVGSRGPRGLLLTDGRFGRGGRFSSSYASDTVLDEGGINGTAGRGFLAARPRASEDKRGVLSDDSSGPVCGT